jgi:parallel beta-helix repeat protein
MLPKPLLIYDEDPVVGIPDAVIAIDGDADFSDTALLEGWPGDGSPENPFIIDGLDIVIDGGDLISIRNTRVNFTISNCNLIGAGGWTPMSAGAGIYLENVTNGELINNNCNNNPFGILLIDSHSNTVFNNTCYNNSYGIRLEDSHSNTVVNNTCNGNIVIFVDESGPPFSGWGITLERSNSNIVANNSCFSNEVGIILWESHSNTVISNTCNNNRIGIYIDDESESNTVENNTFSGNYKHDIVDESGELAHQEFVAQEFAWLLAGCGMILVVAVIAVVQFRRMKIH